MKTSKIVRSGLAGILLVSLLLAIPFLTTSSEERADTEPTGPTIEFSGIKLQIDAEGDIQALVDVYIKRLPHAYGASFRLQYNSKYITPSDFDTNEPLTNAVVAEEDAFFQHNTELLDSGENPFNKEFVISTEKELKYSVLDSGASTLSMGLYLNQTESSYGAFTAVTMLNQSTYWLPSLGVWAANRAGQLAFNSTVSIYRYKPYTSNVYFFNMPAEGVKLGTLSFNVNFDTVEEMVSIFGDLKDVDGVIGIESEYLLKLNGATDCWVIQNFDVNASPVRYTHDAPTPAGGAGTGSSWFNFSFDKTIIKAEALEKTLNLNAYQAYTDGSVADIAALLQKYSPIVVVTYADGSMENLIYEWDNQTPITETVDGGSPPYGHDYNVTYGDLSPVVTYDPVGGVYIATQSYYHRTDDDGVVSLYKYPKPITVEINVQPVTVMGVTADNLSRGIEISSANMGRYSDFSSLELPGEARLVTDIYPGPVSMVVSLPSWENEGDPLSSLNPTPESNGNSGAKWPTAAECDSDLANATQLGSGTYEFKLSGGDITASTIKTRYPWITVEGSFPLVAVRNLDGSNTFYDSSLYVIEEAISDVSVGSEYSNYTDDELKMSIGIARLVTAGGTNYTSMDTDSTFKLYLPDGTYVNPDWFTGDNSGDSAALSASYSSPHGYAEFSLTIEPGINYPLADEYGEIGNRAERAKVRSAINVGGWFYVSVKESRNESDLIPFYVSPRRNNYEESREYDFTGLRNDLFPYISPVPTRVTVPSGIYSESDVYGTSQRYEIRTTYDGLTGQQPGYTKTFEVVNPWDKGTDLSYLPIQDVYGFNALSDGAEFAAFGEIYNDRIPKEEVKMKFEEGYERDAADEAIMIYPFNPLADMNISTYADGTVDTANYDTKQQGYTARQEYVLVIENTGSDDIHGLYIDTQRDFDGDANAQYLSGNFQIIDPPAAFLPAGASTTFTITYDYDLDPRANDQAYLNRIYVGSNQSQVNDDPLGGQKDYLGCFDARFTVSGKAVNRVTVVILPEESETGAKPVVVGKGWIIIGETADDGTLPTGMSSYTPSYDITPSGVLMNYGFGSSTQVADRPVFICVQPYDEYTIRRQLSTYAAYYYDKAGNSVSVAHYNGGAQNDSSPGNAELMEGVFVFLTEMPNYDITIYVEMVEETYSKLRLGNLELFAAETAAELADTWTTANVRPSGGYKIENQIPIYKKVFTKAEITSAGTTAPASGNYLATRGRAGSEGFEYEPNTDQYLAVIPYEAAFVGMETIFRELQWLVTSGTAPAYDDNEAITPEITVAYYNTNVGTSGTALQINPNTASTNPVTSADMVTDVLAAPAPGQSRYVRFAVTYSGTTRYYYLEIVREPGVIIGAPDYGNSPFGMIMLQPDAAYYGSVTADGEILTGQLAAKQNFINNGYKFDSSLLTPKMARSGEIKLENTYHREAWVMLDSGFDPESVVNLSAYSSNADGYDADVEKVTVTDNNLDLDEYVLFLTLGQGFSDTGLKGAKDNSMREVTADSVDRWVEVITLNGGAATQIERFAGVSTTACLTYDDYIKAYRDIGRTAMIHVGVVSSDTADGWAHKGYPVTGTDADGAPIFDETVAAIDIAVRPGVYSMSYVFPDYDGLSHISLERMVVILAAPGDVNADGILSGGDVDVLQNRINDPLGYNETYYRQHEYLNARYYEASIYRFRTADANNDRNVNDIDANAVANAQDLVRTYYLSKNYVYVP